MSRKPPISLVNNVRNININDNDEKIYNIYLINLIKRMILENPVLRPNTSEALKEVNNIKIFLKHPTEENE